MCTAIVVVREHAYVAFSCIVFMKEGVNGPFTEGECILWNDKSYFMQIPSTKRCNY